MSRSNDAGHFFQTSDALATTKRKAAKAKNKHGDPLKLPSKILAAHIDPYSLDTPAIFVAEAAGEVKRVELESGRIDRIFTQGNAPLTCLAICQKPRILFTGSWDKTIYAIPLDDPTQETRKFRGHSDFIKCLHVTTLAGTPILLSGSADTTIVVWNILTGEILQKIQAHAQALQSLTIDPESQDGPNSSSSSSSTLFTATSSPDLRRFALTLTTATETGNENNSSGGGGGGGGGDAGTPLRPHDTSIYALRWDADADLWTASADKTAKHLVRARGWAADTVLAHPDFVRDLAVVDARGLVVTACRDENVRVWEAGSGELIGVYGGHYEEVTGVVPTVDGRTVISVSIDGTVRRWSLDRGEMAKYQEAVEREERGEVEEESASLAEQGKMLTADEEAELAELMEDDD